MDNFIKEIMPTIYQRAVNSSLNIEALVNVEGDVIQDTVPSITKAADSSIAKLNQFMNKRGMSANGKMLNV